jgi:hypothetical protein
MRTRELIAALKALQAEPLGVSMFPQRAEIRSAAVREFGRLNRLAALVPEIIAKLEAQP